MSRFKFLEERFPKLAEYGRKAEEAFEADENICLLNLGRIAENITKILCSQNNIPDYDADELLKLGIIDENIHRKIKTLTEIKNDAVNDEYDSEMSCSRLMVTARELCEWFMSERGESRFGFLADLFPEANPVPPLAELAVYGREAEENLFPNTRYSLICLGDIEEAIVEHILSIKDIEASLHENDQSDRINLLYHKDIISKENKDILHELRLARNKAVHSRYNSTEEGKRLIDEALSVCEWTFRFVMSAGNFIRGIISRVNENSIDVRAGRIQCVVEGEDIPESKETLSERYKEGERRIFKVIDSNGEIIKLSIKDVYTDPWINIARRYEKYEIGQVLNVRVMGFTDNMGAVVEIIGPLEVTEARIPETEYGTKKLHEGEEVRACVKWFDPKNYPYMILSVKDVPAEKKNFIAMCADASPEEIRAMIDEGVDVNKKNHNGMSALMNAAMHNENPEVIRVLIEAGAKVNSLNMNSSGNTALIFAAMYSNPEVVKALIENGADIEIKNADGKRAYDYAQNNERLRDTEILSILEGEKPEEQMQPADEHEEPQEQMQLSDENENLEEQTQLSDENEMPEEQTQLSDETEKPEEQMQLSDDENPQEQTQLSDETGDSEEQTQPADETEKLHEPEPEEPKKLSDEEFIELCRTGSSDEIMKAVSAGANLQARASDSNTALMTAVNADNIEAVKTLLESEVDIEAKNREGNNALMLAVMKNAPEIMNAILAKKPNPDAENSKGQTALMIAAQKSTPEVISLLLDTGSDINHRDSNGNTALTLSFLNKNQENINMLLDYGADVNIQNNSGYNALMMAARTKRIDLVKRLLKKTSNLNSGNNAGDTTLSIASVENNAEVVNEILEAGADINSQNKNGTTALMAALYNYSDVENVIKVLLKHKPDITLRNSKEQTALDIAKNKPSLSGSETLKILLTSEFLKVCRSGSEEEISQAISAGVDVHKTNKSQATGLMFAAQNNTAGAVEVLLDAGADIDAQDINGNTALIYAVSYNTDDVVDVLISRGADVNIMNHSGHKAMNFAKKNYRLDDTPVLKILKDKTRN